MKKGLLVGISTLALSAAMPFAAFADGVGSYGHNAYVGDVDEAIYNVEISWGTMIYDWVFNGNSYEFREHMECTPTVRTAETGGVSSQEVLFSDAACTEVIYEPTDVEIGETYYYKNPAKVSEISVYDTSVNGKVKSTVSFSPRQNYLWVSGTFLEWVALQDNMGVNQEEETVHWQSMFYGNELEENVLFSGMGGPNGRRSEGYLHLENDGTLVDASSITSGDIIGEVTLTITPDYE